MREPPPDRHTRISATYASEILRINYGELCAALDTGECLSYESNSHHRYTCLEWVSRWQTEQAEKRAAALRGDRHDPRFDRYDRSISSRTRSRRYG